MAAKNYRVRVEDVDGASVRYYAALPAAVARFEEMSGFKVDEALREQYWRAVDEGRRVPGVNEVRAVGVVSMYGARVVLECVSQEARAAADAARAAADAPRPWAVVCARQQYGAHDEVLGMAYSIESRHASREDAEAALGAQVDALSGPDGDCGWMEDFQLYVAPADRPRERPAPVEDVEIPF